MDLEKAVPCGARRNFEKTNVREQELSNYSRMANVVN